MFYSLRILPFSYITDLKEDYMVKGGIIKTEADDTTFRMVNCFVV